MNVRMKHFDEDGLGKRRKKYTLGFVVAGFSIATGN